MGRTRSNAPAAGTGPSPGHMLLPGGISCWLLYERSRNRAPTHSTSPTSSPPHLCISYATICLIRSKGSSSSQFGEVLSLRIVEVPRNVGGHGDGQDASHGGSRDDAEAHIRRATECPKVRVNVCGCVPGTKVREFPPFLKSASPPFPRAKPAWIRYPPPV